MVFDVHVNELIKKVNGILMYINKIDLCDKQQIRIIIVESLVLSLIHYCLRIWRTTNHTLLSNVQKVQNFAFREQCLVCFTASYCLFLCYYFFPCFFVLYAFYVYYFINFTSISLILVS